MARILCINPGSTSTKIAVFEGDEALFKKTIRHTSDELAAFEGINDQLDYRLDMILKALEENGIDLASIDGFGARGGGLPPHKAGTFRVNELMVELARGEAIASHPAQLATQIAFELEKRTGKPAFMTNSPTVDEGILIARVTGLKDVYREINCHALNHKEVAHRAAQHLGLEYDRANLVVCHIGGGISIAAHRKGRIIDATNNMFGEGPMTPNRSGALPVSAVVDLCFEQGATRDSVNKRYRSEAGLLDLLGTADAQEVSERVAQGDLYAKNIYDAMIYQIAKFAGEMAAALRFEVDAFVLTGGIAFDEYLVEVLSGYLERLAPIIVIPGELEMEALAHGADDALENGTALSYPPEKVWDPSMLHSTTEE